MDDLLERFIGIHSIAECVHYIFHQFCEFSLVHFKNLKQFKVVMGHVVLFIGINGPMALVWHLGNSGDNNLLFVRL